MSKRELIIISILAVVLGTSMHFVHHVSFFTHWMGYIFPTDECVWDHMKMVFYPMLLLAGYMAISRKNVNRISGPILAGVSGMIGQTVLFYGYEVWLGHSFLPADIVIYVLTMIACVILSDRWNKQKTILRLWPLMIAIAIACIAMFVALSYNHPDWFLFALEAE